MAGFFEFIGKKKRKAKKQLGLVKKLLESKNMAVSDFLSEEDPYIFLQNTVKNPSFDGVRIYKIGESIAFRVQKEAKTHPYGKSYMLDIEGMYDDLISDHYKEERAGMEIIESIVKEFQSFFKKSQEAEQDLRSGEFNRDKDPLGRVLVRQTGTDYSNIVMSKG